jgi:hypothetical protein
MQKVDAKGVEAADEGLLYALVEAAKDAGTDPAILAAAAQLLSSPHMTVDAGLCTSALQAAARNAGTAAYGALALAEAALRRAIPSNLQPSGRAAAACISLATYDTIATQWLEVLKDCMTKATAAAKAAWYDALLQQGAYQHSRAKQCATSVLSSAMSALLTAAEGQQVALTSDTLASMVAVGLSVEDTKAQLAVQAACIARQQDMLPKVVAQLTSEQQQVLSSALIGASEWSLALAASRGPEVLTQILAAAGGQQLPAEALRAALDAAIIGDRPDLTLAYLQTHVLANPNMNCSTLSAVVGGQAGLAQLCKHVLGKVSSTAQQQGHEQNIVAQLVQKMVAEDGVRGRVRKMVAGNSMLLDNTTWQGILDAMVSNAAAQQSNIPEAAAAAADVLALCRLAVNKTRGGAATWHLYAATQLAGRPQCVHLVVACLKVREWSRLLLLPSLNELACFLAVTSHIPTVVF